MRQALGRILRVWWGVSAPMCIVGLAVAWIGVGLDRLWVMLTGIVLCSPLLMGIYAALGVGLIASPIVTIWAL